MHSIPMPYHFNFYSSMFSLCRLSSRSKYITRIQLLFPHYPFPLSRLHCRFREPKLQTRSALGKGQLQHTIKQVQKAVRQVIEIPSSHRWHQPPRMRFISAHLPLTETSVLLRSSTSKMFSCGALADRSKAWQCRPTTKVIGRTSLVAWLVIWF